MRISSLQIFNIANNSIAEANQAITKTQSQLSTGQRVLRPSDDPVAATKIMELEQNLARVDQYGKNIDLAENNLALEESALDGVLNLLQRVREISVQAGNTATLTGQDYKALAAEVDSRLDELLNLVNTRTAGGDYIFSGYKSGTEPFVGDAESGFSYQGTEGQLQIKITETSSIAASDSGKHLFFDIPSEQNTVRTTASSSNTSLPAAKMSIGQVVDQIAYDEFYPEDMVISFGANNEINPPGKNYTVREKSTGNVITPFENVPYEAGEPIEVNGVSFTISGNPASGRTISPASLAFGTVTAVDFRDPLALPPGGLGNSTIDVTVGDTTETLILDQAVTNATDLAALLNDAGNGNAAKLAALGVSVDDTGFTMPIGINFSIEKGDANVDLALGLATTSEIRTTNGRIESGDKFFVDSSENQDVLTTLARLSEAMKGVDGSAESKDFVAQTVSDTLSNLDHAQVAILETTSSLGARFNTIESTRELHLDTELVSREIMSELRDLDYAEAASRLAAQSLILEAAQATFVKVSQLSLFSRL